MLGGDISNKQASILAFNIDNLLFKDKGDLNLVGRIRNKLMNDKQRFLSREVDKVFIDTINAIWIKHPYSIYFVTFTPYLDDLLSIIDKNSISYTTLDEKFEWEDVRRECGLRYMYYFDNDEELLSYISTNNALHINKLNTIIN